MDQSVSTKLHESKLKSFYWLDSEPVLKNKENMDFSPTA